MVKDQATEMISHLTAQFEEKPNVEGLVRALGIVLNDFEVVMDDLVVQRWLVNAVGQQLDGIGTIVDQSRIINQSIARVFFGFEGQTAAVGFGQARFRRWGENWKTSTRLNDEEYRKVLYAKIYKNTSNCTIEEVLRIIGILFDTDKVILHEIGNAKLIFSVGRKITKNEILFIDSLNLIVKAGGVGMERRSHFNEKHFGFRGQKYAVGFGQAPFATAF